MTEADNKLYVMTKQSYYTYVFAFTVLSGSYPISPAYFEVYGSATYQMNTYCGVFTSTSGYFAGNMNSDFTYVKFDITNGN